MCVFTKCTCTRAILKMDELTGTWNSTLNHALTKEYDTHLRSTNLYIHVFSLKTSRFSFPPKRTKIERRKKWQYNLQEHLLRVVCVTLPNYSMTSSNQNFPCVLGTLRSGACSNFERVALKCWSGLNYSRRLMAFIIWTRSLKSTREYVVIHVTLML